MCQLLLTMRNKGRNRRARNPRLLSKHVEVVLRKPLAPLDRLESSPDRDQHNDVEGGEQEEEQRGGERPENVAKRFEIVEAPADFEAAKPTAIESKMTTSEWPSEKKKPTPTGRWPCCISLRVDVVDRRDMIGVDRMPQTERIGEERRAEQHRVVAQGGEGPDPNNNICRR